MQAAAASPLLCQGHRRTGVRSASSPMLQKDANLAYHKTIRSDLVAVADRRQLKRFIVKRVVEHCILREYVGCRTICET